MQILIVEDIEQQAAWLTEKLKGLFPRATVRHIRTESGFIDGFDEISDTPPDLVLMDMMLRWADPAPDAPMTPQAYAGFQRAGLRCVNMLQSHPGTSRVPIIITTVLEDVDFEPGELPANVSLVTKEVDPSGLFAEIRKRVRA